MNSLNNLLTRIRVFIRTVRGIGLRGTLQLTLVQWEAIRGGGAGKIHKIAVAGLPHPVFIRGGGSSDAIVLYQMFGVREYEPATTLHSVNFIMDAGANIGLASLYFLRAYPSARILAIEPDTGNLKMCRMNLDPYGDRIVLCSGAVWSKCCRLVQVPSSAEWALGVRAAEPGEEATIEAFDLPSLLSRTGETGIDLLKLDIEGSEAEIFASGAQPWLGAVHNIIIEFHGAVCERRFLHAIEGFRYRHIQRPMVEFFFDMSPRLVPAEQAAQNS